MVVIDSEILEETKSFPWFESCGVTKNTEISFPFKHVNSWEDAIISCSSEEWIYHVEEAQGVMTEHLSSHHTNQYQVNWNKLSKIAKTHIESYIMPKIIEIENENNLGKEFIDSASWDVLNGIMEYSYKKYTPPLFFRNLLNIYKLGHFPCGIDKDHKILIY